MNPAALDNITLIVPANGSKKYGLGGNMLYVQNASFPFRMQFDAGSVFPTQAGFKFGPDADGFNTVTFFNDQPTPLTLNFYRGALGVDFVGGSEVKDASTFALGNMGVAGSAGIAVPQATVVNGLFTNLAAAIVVPGSYQGHRRKFLTINLPNAHDWIYMLDSSGRVFSRLYCPAGSALNITFETDSTFLLLGVDASYTVNIGEIYYSN